MTSKCNNCTEKKCSATGNTGGFAFILVLFILVILVGAAWAY